jgi:hypothetical protein
MNALLVDSAKPAFPSMTVSLSLRTGLTPCGLGHFFGQKPKLRHDQGAALPTRRMTAFFSLILRRIL